jgi:hypothetical protein
VAGLVSGMNSARRCGAIVHAHESRASMAVADSNHRLDRKWISTPRMRLRAANVRIANAAVAKDLARKSSKQAHGPRRGKLPVAANRVLRPVGSHFESDMADLPSRCADMRPQPRGVEESDYLNGMRRAMPL